eukprot:CAMPEP_0115001804 /NCGR_PEP_ID=MMETSP0216-20121206/17615_1 /TAXON_ID=223996 /ORGANISM="Protocruzia adherens, Strain Boccale" /LENGTH=192 /DNA_ID=CAMNT_0002367251 /DNA_START=147 /DNA_END=721 /DNA_ORIENTATION=+
MEVKTERIWDYKGDHYVHRIVRHLEDDVQVQLPDIDSRRTTEGDMKYWKLEDESFHWELNYILTTQLQEQREYFERRINDLLTSSSNIFKLEELNEVDRALEQKRQKYSKKITDLEKDLKSREKTVNKLKSKISELDNDKEVLNELNASLESSHASIQNPKKEKTVTASNQLKTEIHNEEDRKKKLETKIAA